MRLKSFVLAAGCLGSGYASVDRCHELMADSTEEFLPMRLGFVYDTMEGPPELLEHMETLILPQLTSWVKQTVKVRQLPEGVYIFPNSRESVSEELTIFKCGSLTVPAPEGFVEVSDVDLVIVLSILDDDNLPSGHAMPCQLNACGRPVAASVRISTSAIKAAIKSGSNDDLNEIMLHELIHALGFDVDVFSQFRDKITLERLSPYRPPIRYYCKQREDGTLDVRWNVPLMEVEQDTFPFRWPGNILRAIDARGLRKEDCRCPIDPERTYTDADIEHCIAHPNHCAIAVTSPNVAEKAREYYGCDSLEGQELENTVLRCESLFDTHWKARTLKGEVMNTGVANHAGSWLSPMTLALLEDSGWYEIDYSVASTLVPTASYGYKAGCEFAIGKCLVNGEPVDPIFFCARADIGTLGCSADATRITQCSSPRYGFGRSVWAPRMAGIPRIDHPAYDYGIGYDYALFGMDFCPVYETRQVCIGGRGDYLNARCLETGFGAGICVPIHCSEDGSKYWVKDIGWCDREGVKLAIPNVGRWRIDSSMYQSVTCRDPAVICADWNLVHLLPTSPFRSIPVIAWESTPGIPSSNLAPDVPAVPPTDDQTVQQRLDY